MDNILVDTGIIPVEYIQNSLRNTKYSVYFILFKTRKEAYMSLWPDFDESKCFDYLEFAKENTVKHQVEVSKYYNEAFSSIISDYRTMQISERVRLRLKPWRNDFYDLMLISTLVTNYLELLLEIRPKFLFYHSTPHEIYSWTLIKTAEILGIPLYLSKTTPLPWKSYLVKGLDEHHIERVDYNSDLRVSPKLVDDYYKLNSLDYKDAIPSYEKKRLDARKGKFWSWKKELIEPLHRPHMIVSVLRKYYLYKHYQKLATKDIKPNSILVFLHYQPERTTLPEGYEFAQQFHMIRTINLALPDYQIYVKEHPSIFVGHFDIRYRSIEFYDMLNSMKNVHLVDIEQDSFGLLDKSLCISTVTGTVGIQALIRGKSVLCFGAASYKSFNGCYSIHSTDDIIKAIRSIENGDTKEISESTCRSLHEVDEISASGISKDDIVEDFYNQDYRLYADGRVLFHLLND